MIDEGGGDQIILFAIINLWFTTDVLAFVRMWLINICFHTSQSKERGGDKFSLSAIIKSNLYLSGPASGLNYFVLTSEVLFYGLGKLALITQTNKDTCLIS